MKGLNFVPPLRFCASERAPLPGDARLTQGLARMNQ